jgi:hypothetical protein
MERTDRTKEELLDAYEQATYDLAYLMRDSQLNGENGLELLNEISFRRRRAMIQADADAHDGEPNPILAIVLFSSHREV